MHHRLVQRRRNPLCYVHSRWFCARLHSTLPPKVTDLVEKHAAIPPRPLNLATLLSFGRPLSAGSLLDSVSYTLAEIPRRLATRVRSLEALPFIVGTNPFIANTLQSYRESFYWLATYPTVSNLQENAQFVIKLQQLVQHHSNDVATMAKGFVFPSFHLDVFDGKGYQASKNVHVTFHRTKLATFWMAPSETGFLFASLRNNILPYLRLSGTPRRILSELLTQNALLIT